MVQTEYKVSGEDSGTVRRESAPLAEPAGSSIPDPVPEPEPTPPPAPAETAEDGSGVQESPAEPDNIHKRRALAALEQRRSLNRGP